MFRKLLAIATIVITAIAAPFTFSPLPPSIDNGEVIPNARVSIQGRAPVVVSQTNKPYEIIVNGVPMTPRSTVWSRGSTHLLALQSNGVPYSFFTPTYSVKGLSNSEVEFETLDFSDLITELFDASDPISAVETTPITGGQVSWSRAGCLTDPDRLHTALINLNVDTTTLNRFNRSIQAVVDYFFAFYSFVSIRYQSAFGVRIHIRNFQIGGGSYWDNAVPGGTPDVLLLLMRAFRMTGVGTALSIVHHSKLSFTGVVGRAAAFSLCTDGAVSWATYTPDFTKGTLVAIHELGHIFGALHDGDPAHLSCAGQCLDCSACGCVGPYIMNPFVNNATQFSACSQQSICNLINSRLQAAKFGDCLRTPTCGNGICEEDELGCFRDCPVCEDLFCNSGEQCLYDCAPPTLLQFTMVYNQTQAGFRPRLNISNPFPRIIVTFPDSSQAFGNGQISVPYRFLFSPFQYRFDTPQIPNLYPLGVLQETKSSKFENRSFVIPHQYYQINIYQINITGHQNFINADPNAEILYSRFDRSSSNLNNVRPAMGIVAYADLGREMRVSFYRLNQTFAFSENCTILMTPALSFRSIRWYTVRISTLFENVDIHRRNQYVGRYQPLNGEILYHTCYSEEAVKLIDPLTHFNISFPVLPGRSQRVLF